MKPMTLPGRTGPAVDASSQPMRVAVDAARRPGVALAAVVVIGVCAALAGTLLVRADRRVPVLALAQPVAAGHQIGEGDLRVVRVGASGVPLVQAQDRHQVIGATASTDLLTGMLLTPDMLTDPFIPGPGDAVVGVALKPGQLPAGGLQPSDLVQVVSTGSTGDPGGVSDAVVLAATARVFDVRIADDGSELVTISVVVPQQAAAAVARAASTGEASLVLLPRAEP